MAVFTPETDHLCETGYPFDNSRQIGNSSWKCNGFYFEWTIRLTLSANFDGQFEDELSVPDSLCTAALSPQRKNGKRVHVCGGGGDCTQASLRRMIHFLALVWKRPTTKFPCPVFLMIQKDCTERLSAVTCPYYRPHYSARLMYSGSRGPSFSLFLFFLFPQVCHRNALTEIAWEDAVQGLGMAMSTVASEKNRELLFISNVFYKQGHLCVLFH